MKTAHRGGARSRRARPSSCALATTVALALLLPAAPALGQCQPAWLGGDFNGDVNIPPSVSQYWDPDGPGPAKPVVVVAGEMVILGGLRVGYIGAWDGAHWTNLDGGLNDIAHGLTTWDPDGAGPAGDLLVVGGEFSAAGGVAAQHIAAWDGSTWSALGSGLPGTVVGLTAHDADGPGPAPSFLYATSFDVPSESGQLYRWDGVSWSLLAVTSTAGFLGSLASYDPDGAGPALPLLIAAGYFTAIDGVPANSIASWDGSTWARMGSGVSIGGSLITMTVYDPDDAGPGNPLLAVGGQFGAIGGSVSGGLAVWNGSAWQGIGTGVYPSAMWVTEVDVVDPDGPGGVLPRLAVGGRYLVAGGNFAPALALWNGSTFETAPFPFGGNGTIDAVAGWMDDSGGPAVFAAGGYQAAPGVTNRLAEWSSGVLRPIGAAPDGEVRALTRFAVPGVSGPIDPPIIAAGDFNFIGDDASASLAVWDGRSWEPLGDDVIGNSVYTFDVSSALGSRLIAGGAFTAIGPVALSNIGQFDGAAWSAIGPGFNGTVRALLTGDPDGPGPLGEVLIAGGSFTTSGGAFRARIAYWNGSSWQPFDFGFADGSVTCLILADIDGPGPLPRTLVAGGTFLSAAGVSTPRIARWTGSSWQPVGDGFNDTVNDLHLFDVDGAGPMGPVLVAAGLISASGPAGLGGAAYWNGSAWVRLGDFSDVAGATALASYTPVGGGPDVLVAVGAFRGGASFYDGAEWVPMGTGVLSGQPPRVYSLLPFDPDGAGPSGPIIMVGGNFNIIGEQVSGDVGRWATHPVPWIIDHPQDTSDDPARFTARPALGYAELPGGLAYQWSRNGVPISDGPGGASPGGGTVSGASGLLTLTDPVTLIIDGATGGDGGDYTCTFTNDCGSATTEPARLDACRVDFTGDGLVDFVDYLAFLNLYEAADDAADLTGDGLVDFADYLQFLNEYEAGC